MMGLVFILFQSEDPELLIKNQSSMYSNTSNSDRKKQITEAILVPSSKYPSLLAAT